MSKKFPLTPEMLVRTEDLIAAHAAVNREGIEQALTRLMSREPVLTKYLFDEWHAVYLQMGRKLPRPGHYLRQQQRMNMALLVATTAMARAHYRLWRGTAVGTLLEQIDPSLAE